ncbi:27013_t:CDS:1, partial [Gigaspora margarita]
MEQKELSQKEEKQKIVCINCSKKVKKRCNGLKIIFGDGEVGPKLIPCERCSEMGKECNVRPHCVSCKKKLDTLGFCAKEECRRVQMLEKEIRRAEKEVENLQMLLKEQSKTILTLEQRIQRLIFG